MNVKERSNKKYTCYDYEGLFKGGIDDISHWVCYVVNNDIIHTNVVTLKDTQRSSDEDNNSSQERTPLDERWLSKEIEDKEINKISFDGKFKTVSVSVAVDVQTGLLSIAFDKDIEMTSIISDIVPPLT